MSAAVQLKLLTLLNVSAIKRPLEVDQPGGYKRGSLTPDVGSPEPSSVRIQKGDESNQTKDGEPPKKKKKGVVIGGEIGPSGSQSGARAKDKKTLGKKSKTREKQTETQSEKNQASSSSSSSLSSRVQTEAESDDEAAETAAMSTTKSGQGEQLVSEDIQPGRKAH